jgi:hypothetical protein
VYWIWKEVSNSQPVSSSCNLWDSEHSDTAPLSHRNLAMVAKEEYQERIVTIDGHNMLWKSSRLLSQACYADINTFVPKFLDKSDTLTAVRKVHRIYGRWNLMKIDIRIKGSEDLWKAVPIFIADAICDTYIWQLSHDSFGRCVHEVDSATIIWFLKCIFCCESMK